jgi:hypothetical protein
MSLTLQPVPFVNGEGGSRLALVATNLLGNVKSELYSDSATETMDKARDMASYPDTIVYIYSTTNEGERYGTPFARVQRDGVGDVKYQSL